MDKRIRRLMYRKFVMGMGLHDLAMWLETQGYKRRTLKPKLAEVIEFKPRPEEQTFPMQRGPQMSLLTVLFLIFLVLKLAGIITWSWLVVCLPLIAQGAIFVSFVLVAASVGKR